MNFTNKEFGSVRCIEINNEPWFVGKDVAESLGYSNASKAVSVHVDTEDKQMIMLDIADSQNGNVPSGKTKTAFINESGLYALIFSSKLHLQRNLKDGLHQKSFHKSDEQDHTHLLLNSLLNKNLFFKP